MRHVLTLSCVILLNLLITSAQYYDDEELEYDDDDALIEVGHRDGYIVS